MDQKHGTGSGTTGSTVLDAAGMLRPCHLAPAPKGTKHAIQPDREVDRDGRDPDPRP